MEGMKEGRDCGIVAERDDLGIDEEKSSTYAEFCLTDKHWSSSEIDFGVRDMIEELDGTDTSKIACAKLEFPV